MVGKCFSKLSYKTLIIDVYFFVICFHLTYVCNKPKHIYTNEHPHMYIDLFSYLLFNNCILIIFKVIANVTLHQSVCQITVLQELSANSFSESGLVWISFVRKFQKYPKRLSKQFATFISTPQNNKTWSQKTKVFKMFGKQARRNLVDRRNENIHPFLRASFGQTRNNLSSIKRNECPNNAHCYVLPLSPFVK